MQIKTYTNNSETIVVNKNLTLLDTVEAILEETQDVSNPKLIMSRKNILPNYIYIPIFNRYYYINNISIMDNNRYQLDCSVDVLMSFKFQILDSYQHVIRQRNAYNMYLKDSNLQIINKVQRQALNFNEPSEGWIFENDLSDTGYYYVINAV